MVVGALCVWHQPQIISLVLSKGCLTSSTPNIWLDVQRGCFSSDFCPDMLPKELLKTNVKASVFEFEQHSPAVCPEQALVQWGPSALPHTLQCYRTRDMIQLPTLFVAAHESVYGFVLFSCFGKMPFKKCHLPLPPLFMHIIQEVWVKCPSSSWTAITSNQAAHGSSSWCQSSASEGSPPSTPCVMCHGHETNRSICCFSPICSRLSFPASFVFASSSMFCCHTSGFEHGPNSWIWSLAAVCCQHFPTEDRDGIQKARGNGGQAGNIHSRWMLRQPNHYRNNVLISSFHSALWASDSSSRLSYPLLYYFWKCRLPPLLPLSLNKLFLDTDLYSRLCYPHG